MVGVVMRVVGRAHLARQCASGRKSSLGARLRTRKVTTAALKALRCSAFVDWSWSLFLYWSHEQQLGRCPKPHQRRRLWTPQGALPLDPFLRPGLSAFPCYPLSLIRLSFPLHYSKKSFHEQPLAEAPCDIILRPLIPRHREQLIRRPNFHHIP